MWIAIPIAATLAVGLAVASDASAHSVHEAAPVVVPADPALSAKPALPHIRAAADFTLKDPDGQAVSLSGLGRKVRLVSFVYTSCTAACPLLTARLAQLQEALFDSGHSREIALITVTVDAARDDQAAMRAYAERFGADPANWLFLTESANRLQPVLTAYDEWSKPIPGGDLDHPARLHLIDRNGMVREIYSLSFFDERQALVDVLTLAAEPAS